MVGGEMKLEIQTPFLRVAHGIPVGVSLAPDCICGPACVPCVVTEVAQLGWCLAILQG